MLILDAIEGGAPTDQVAAVEPDRELSEARLGTAIAQIEIETRGRLPADVLVDLDEAGDRPGQRRVGRVDRAAQDVATFVAIVAAQHQVFRQFGDLVIEGQVPPVDPDRCTRYRLEHEADGGLARMLGLQRRVAAGRHRHLRRTVRRQTRHRAALGVGELLVPERHDRGRLRRVQLGQRRRSNSGPGRGAQQQRLQRPPAQRGLGADAGAEVAVVVGAHGQLRIERVHHGQDQFGVERLGLTRTRTRRTALG